MERTKLTVTELVQQSLNELRQAIVGKDDVLLWILGAVLAGGHILLEDIPGVGKTTTALAMARVLDFSFGRVQFTPDVLPSDITGYCVPNKEGGLSYRPGAAMCNLFLADELNRGTSRTQSALLEIMEEGHITVDGVTHPAHSPFVVIATQNPCGAAGTQSLPDSQLDRFMVSLSMGYPSPRDEAVMIQRRQSENPLEAVHRVLSPQDVLCCRELVRRTYMADLVVQYLVGLVGATREHPALSRGASPRAALAVSAMAKAVARMRSRDFVVPGDVREVLSVTLRHRIILTPSAQAQGMTAEEVLQEILEGAAVPQLR